MEVVKETLVELGKEGIKEAKDLAKFDKDMWKQVAESLNRLGGKMKNLDKEVEKTSMVPQTLYLFGAKMQMFQYLDYPKQGSTWNQQGYL
eukprot:10954707-Ditylum_brightwellii.AAC.1